MPVTVSLISCVAGLYILFSPMGLVNGMSMAGAGLLGALVLGNLILWMLAGKLR